MVNRTSHADVFKAVKELRNALGDTQQQFAQRTGLAIRSVARFEAERIPSPRILAMLADLAYANRLDDIGAVLRLAMANSLGARCQIDWMPRGPRTLEEFRLEQAFRSCVFDNPFSVKACSIRQILAIS